MRPRNKGDFYDKPNSYTFLNLRPARLRPARARPARVRPARARPTRVRPARARPARVRPARARPTRVRPARPRPARVRPASKRPNATRPKTYLRPKSITTSLCMLKIAKSDLRILRPILAFVLEVRPNYAYCGICLIQY